MTNFLDHYCERTLPQLWNEPLNVLTNIAFLAVFYPVLRSLQKLSRENDMPLWDLWILTGFIAFVGIGSATWHVLASSWALWADRIPILLFISLYLVSCLLRVFNMSLIVALSALVLFHTVNTLVQFMFPAYTMNGSLFYIPTLVILFVMTILLWLKRNKSIRKYFLSACVLFSVAIIFRSIDLVACDIIPTGTHYIWHLLIAFTMYPLMIALIRTTMTDTVYEK